MKSLTIKTLLAEFLFLNGVPFAFLCRHFIGDVWLSLAAFFAAFAIDWIFTFLIFSSRWNIESKSFFRAGISALAGTMFCFLLLLFFRDDSFFLWLYACAVHTFARYCISFVFLTKNSQSKK